MSVVHAFVPALIMLLSHVESSGIGTSLAAFAAGAIAIAPSARIKLMLSRRVEAKISDMGAPFAGAPVKGKVCAPRFFTQNARLGRERSPRRVHRVQIVHNRECRKG